MSDPTSFASSMLQGAHNNTFSNSTFVIREDRIAAFDILRQAASPSAFHSFVGRPDPGTCYPNTRVALLEGLEKWSKGLELPDNLFNAGLDKDWSIDKSPQLRNLPIMWLRGGAGAGKSAVAQTFAERCEDLGHIVASFFFFSTDNTRNTANRLFATLAYQIAQADPGARAVIEIVVHRNPELFNQDFKKQIVSLILNPIQTSMQRPDADEHQRQCVIIIDGLDECTGGEVQAGIVRAVSDALRAGSSDFTKPHPRFLICSRPEEPITRVFRSPLLQDMYTSVNISKDTNAHHDIRTFLNGKLAEIKATHGRADLIPDSWPSGLAISNLVSNSSGHFIYAETVVRLLSNDPRPVIALDGILGLRALPQRVREPFAELDQLYRHVLLRALKKCSMHVVLRFLGFLVAGFLYLDPKVNLDVIGSFLELEDGDLDTLLGAISSLISVRPLVGDPHRPSSKIAFYHKSLNDFLCHKSRAGEFYIAVNVVCASVMDRCLEIASKVTSLHLNNDIFKVAMYCARQLTPDISNGAQSNLLLGLTRQRQLSPLYQQADKLGHFRATCAVNCFKYWRKLTESVQDNHQLVKDATAIMIGIIKNLAPLSSPALPLLMCEKLTTQLSVYSLPSRLTATPLAELVHRFHSLEPTDVAHFEKLLEDEEMGECRLTGQRFTEACLHWTTQLTTNLHLFPSNSRMILQNQRNLILNEPGRRRRTPFLWRRMKKTVRPHQIKGRAYFLHSHQVFLIQPMGESGVSYWVTCASTNRELLFISPSNLVLNRNRHSLLSNEKSRHKPLWWGGLNATTWHGGKTTLSGYMRIRFSGQFFFIPRHKIVKRHFQNRGKVMVANARSVDRHKRRAFSLVLRRLPAMLAKASKSDSLAALRTRAFTPLARCFPGLMQRVKRALEKYAARHGYNSPYVDAGPKYFANMEPREDLVTANEAAVPSATPPEEIVSLHFRSALPHGEKRRRPSPPRDCPSRNVCSEPGCRLMISKNYRCVTCSSPDCFRKYHLSCQGLNEVPLSQWFCDEGCERDAAVRKRMRYKL